MGETAFARGFRRYKDSLPGRVTFLEVCLAAKAILLRTISDDGTWYIIWHNNKEPLCSRELSIAQQRFLEVKRNEEN